MKVYHFDLDGYFVGESDAFADPMVEGRFLIPANATDVAPPVPGANQAPKWNGSAWTLVDSPAYLKAQADAAAEAEAKKFMVLYRNKAGFDTKVIGGVPKSAYVAPSDPNIAAQEFAEAPAGWDSKDADGVALKAIVGGALVDRDPIRVAKDPGHWGPYKAAKDQEVLDLLTAATGKKMALTTHLSIQAEAQDILLNQSEYTQAEIDAAIATRNTYKTVYAQIKAIRAQVEAYWLTLDAE